MLNLRILKAWPNWGIIPLMLAIWIVVGLLGAQLLGATAWHQQGTN